MALGGSFWGNAVTAGDKALREWQALWMQEEESKRQDARAQDQLTIQQQDMELRERLSQAQEAGADRRQLAALTAETDLARWETFNKITDPVQRANFARNLFDNGSVYAQDAMALVEQSFYSDLASAQDYLDQILNPVDATFIPHASFTRAAAQMVGNSLQYTGDELTDFVNDWVTESQKQREEGEEAQNIRLDELREGLLTSVANRLNTESGTALTDAQREHLLATTEELRAQGIRNEDLHQLETAIGWRNYLLLGEELTKATFENQHLNPAILEGVLYDNKGKRLSNEFTEATRDAMVSQVVSEAAIAGYNVEQARVDALFSFDMAALEMDLQKLNVDGAETTLRRMDAEIEGMYQQMILTGVDIESAQIDVANKRVAGVIAVVTSGMPSLLHGPEVRETLAKVVGEDHVGEVLNELITISTHTKDEAAAVSAANLAIALAEERNADDMADAALKQAQEGAELTSLQRQYYVQGIEFQEEMGRAGIEFQNRNRTSNGNGDDEEPGSPEPVNLADAYSEALTDTKMNTEHVSDAFAQLNKVRDTVTADQGLLTDARAGNTQALQVLQAKYGANLSADQIDRIFGVQWDEQVRSAELELVNRINAVFTSAYEKSGGQVLLPPSVFGLDWDDPQYREAISRHPDAFERVYDTENAPPGIDIDLANELQRDLQGIGFGISPEAVLMPGGGIEVIYEDLVRRYGEDVVHGVGLRQPTDLVPIIQARHQEFQSHLTPVEAFFKEKGWDVYSPGDRQTAQDYFMQMLADSRDISALINSGASLSPEAAEALRTRMREYANNIPGGTQQLLSIQSSNPSAFLPFFVDSANRINQVLSDFQWLDGAMDTPLTRALRNRR